MITAQALSNLVDGHMIGDGDVSVSGVASLTHALDGEVSFVLTPKYKRSASQSKASVLIVYEEVSFSGVQIVVSHPRKAMAKVITYFKLQNEVKKTPEIDALAKISSSVVMSENVSVGAFAVVGDQVEIGAGCQIGSHVSIARGCQLGQGCVIHPGVVLGEGVSLGDRVIIQSGTVVGMDGYGYYQEKESHYRMPHLGSVVIEEDVEVGASVTIDRGCLGNTVIGAGTKIDNLVQIAHNVQIGQNCLILSQVALVGGVELGNSVIIGGQVGVDAVKINNRVVVASKSGVTKDIPEGMFYSGFPARPHRDILKEQAAVKKLIRGLTDKKGGSHA